MQSGVSDPMKKTIILLVVIAAFLAAGYVIWDHSNQEEMNAQNLYGRTFVWEKEGFGGDFTITLNEDGTYEYYAGYLSSYIGQGNWTVTGSELTMTETSGYDLTFHFTVKENELVYIAEGSSGFAYVTVEDGDRFIGL